MKPAALLVLLSALAGPSSDVRASEFIYRGQLVENGEPAHGRYDLRIALYTQAQGGVALSPPTEVSGVVVDAGRFAVPVSMPGLPDAAGGAWVDVEVKAAEEVHWERIPGRTSVVLKAGACPTGWTLEGNAGIDAVVNFLGTTDAQPLVLRASNTRAGHFERVASTDPFLGETATNVLLGDPLNRIDSGVVGATVSGGGGVTFEGAFTPKSNRVSGRFGTIGGGMGNLAGARATVGGGLQNVAAGDASVSGGTFNSAQGNASSVGGGVFNRAEGDNAVVAGGTGNLASGRSAGVGAGTGNQARGLGAVVPGGANAVAGGDFSVALGRNAIVRSRDGVGVRGTGEPETCDDVVGAESCGDEGTLVFADALDRGFVSGGPNQFLIRAEGGVGIQPGAAGAGDEVANAPEALLHVFEGSAGDVSAPASNTLAVFESDTHAFLRMHTPDSQERGLLFGDPVGGSADGGIIYNGANAMQFRTHGNVARMTLGSDGVLAVVNDINVGDDLAVGGSISVNALGAAGSNSICRNASNQIASCSSSARYKDDITGLDLGLDAVLALRPVSYRWKADGAHDVGFVAEEVAHIDPRLVTRGVDGEIEGVKYERLSAVLAAALQELWLREQAHAGEMDALRREQAALAARIESLREELAGRAGRRRP